MRLRRSFEIARGGRVVEGSVGGGTGMIGYGWKGGIGTASRRLDRKSGGYTVGVLVQLNCGRPIELTVAGVPIGKDLRPGHNPFSTQELGSIIIVAAYRCASDAASTETNRATTHYRPRAHRQRFRQRLRRPVHRIFNGQCFEREKIRSREREDAAKLSRMDPLFTAAVQATEEAIINALIAARTVVGINGYRVEAIPHDRLADLMRKYGR